MKTRILITTLIISLAITTQAYASTTISPTPNAAMTNQINQLKAKIASQVSKLNLVEKRGVIGTIQGISDNQITLTTINGNIQYIDLDEITKFSSAGSQSFGLSDLKKGMQISVLGIYNKESQRILARYVDTVTVPTRYTGEISAIDGKKFQLTIATANGKSAKVAIDTSSAIVSYSGGASLNQYGFSKLNIGDRVEVIGYPDKTNASLLIAARMIDYLDAPKDPQISIITPAPSPTIAPASSGAKAIKPVK